MIQVGIQENIKLGKAERNDKGTLNLVFERGSKGDIMEDFNSSSDNTSSGGESAGVLLFGFTLTGKDGQPKKAVDLSVEIKKFKDKLTHILLGYLVSKDIAWDIFKGTGLKTKEDVNAKLVSQDILDKVYGNIADQFVAMINKNKVLSSDKLFRVKFVRQSSNKHFPTLPTYAPFWESMEIPVESSTLAYTQYEKDKNLNSAAKAVVTSDTPEVSVEEEAALAGMFNN